jgi:hypothetical protein
LHTSTEILDLNAAAREVLAHSADDLLRLRVSVWQAYADDLPDITGDRAQMKRVILNLLRSALHAMKAGDRERRLIIRTEAEEGGVSLSVQGPASYSPLLIESCGAQVPACHPVPARRCWRCSFPVSSLPSVAETETAYQMEIKSCIRQSPHY